MIVAPSRQAVSPKTYTINAGKGTYIGPAYQGFKAVARTYGFYKDIKPYLPEEIIKKYTGKYKYKPRKRLTAYAFQTRGFLKKSNGPKTSQLKQKCFLQPNVRRHNNSNNCIR